MRGKGIKELNSNRRGSQLVTLLVQVPKYDLTAVFLCSIESVADVDMHYSYRSLSDRQQELMEEFLKEEEDRAEKGESDCKSHSFAKTVSETVDRIKKFIKTKTGEPEPETQS